MSLPVYVEVSLPWYYLTFKYHPEVVEDLKFDLPVYSRGWDPDRRAWRIAYDYAHEAFDILKRYGYRIEPYSDPSEAEEPEPEPEREYRYEPYKNGNRTLTTAWQTLHIAEGAPPEVVRAAYRAMAKLHHPDTGGSEEKMKEINDAWQLLNR
jgi:hypothetical protein